MIALPAFALSPWAELLPYAALGVLPALFGRFAPSRGRGRIVLLSGCLQVFAVVVMSAVSALGLPYLGMMGLLALMCGLLHFAVASWRIGIPGALIFVFAAGASILPADGRAVVERGTATATVCALAWLICGLTEAWRRHARTQAEFPEEVPIPLRERGLTAARIVMGSAAAAFVAHGFGAAHPAWAAMGAVAVMQSQHLHVSMNRALQRMVGTVVGAALVWMILTMEPSLSWVIGCIALFQLFTEVVIGYNYALGQIAVTPMALLMSCLAAGPGANGSAMAMERVLDTIIGAAIGIVMMVVLSRLEDRKLLAHRHASK